MKRLSRNILDGILTICFIFVVAVGGGLLLFVSLFKGYELLSFFLPPFLSVAFVALGIVHFIWYCGRKKEKCPACKAWSLDWSWGPVGKDKPIPHFYGCKSCGARYYSWSRGSWQDASGPEYDRYYIDGTVVRIYQDNEEVVGVAS